MARRGWWSHDNRHAYCIYQDTDRTHTAVLRWNTVTGDVDVIFEEEPEAKIILSDQYNVTVMATPLPGTEELVWAPEDHVLPR